MTRRGGATSIVASPVLVGAVTTLIVLVSVYLSYNANTGLPFVPTYNLRAQLPGGANLVPGNEVRLGGFRIGVIDKIEPGTAIVRGRPRSVAVLLMKLDKSAQPLPSDTTVLVRPRSALGLKYVQLTPGKSQRTFRDGDTIPLKQATAPVEFDDLLNTFDARTRQNSQDALQGYGDAFAGRGTDINAAIQGLAPFFRYLAPVMADLSDPSTQLDQFFRQIGRASAQVAPVAAVQAQLFANMADTFAAIGRDPAALAATIEKSPPTEATAIESFRIQRPFLADFTDLSARVLLKSGGNFQEDVAYDAFGARPSDLPPNVDPIGATVGPDNEPAYVLHNQPYPPAIDAQGNADCIKGQFGYPAGPLLDDPGRYKPVNASGKDQFPSTPGSRPYDQDTYNTWQRLHGGGGHVVAADNPPFLYGKTFTGLANLSQVDQGLRNDGIAP